MTAQRLSTWCALRCKEKQFQAFLRVPDERTAAHSVRAICEVRSRGEIDSNPQAQRRFHEYIRLPYQQFLEEAANDHTHDND